MKDQHRDKQPGTRSADRQGSEGQRGGRQPGGHDSSHQPGAARTGSAGRQNREDPRSSSFIPLDKDDIF